MHFLKTLLVYPKWYTIDLGLNSEFYIYIQARLNLYFKSNTIQVHA